MTKKLLIALLLPLGVVSCNKPLEKPFIITSKGEGDITCWYFYQDKNGTKHSFNDLKNKYSVGDTLK